MVYLQGSSSIQIVPAVQKYAARVDNYVRGSAWIATPFASTELLKRSPDANNYSFTEEEKRHFESDPKAYLQFRKSMEREVSSLFASLARSTVKFTQTLQTAERRPRSHPQG